MTERTELTDRFLKEFCNGRMPRPESINISILELKSDSVKFKITINDEEGELVKICDYQLYHGQSLTIMDLAKLFEFRISAA